MRQIQVSTDVYAAIWAARRTGEDSEEAILRRLLKVPDLAVVESKRPAKVGFEDPRHNIRLPEGFEIFRTYKGKRIRAQARDGKWVVPETGDAYASLNLLSHAITGNNENTWRNWYFLERGTRVLIDALRHRSPKTPDELGL